METNDSQRLAILERDFMLIKAQTETLAKREWVHDIITPMRDSMVKIESSIATMTGDMKLLFSTQDDLLKEKAAQERQIHEEKLKALQAQTFGALVKEKWQPFMAMLAALLVVVVGVGGALAWWIVNHVLPMSPK